MGTWGTDAFGNDDAMDWLAELESEGLPAAGGAVQAVLELAPEYLEAPVCAAALAAAEIIAGLRGHPAAELPEAVSAWLAANADADPGEELTRNARRAVELVAAGSELAELWDESDDAPRWRAAVADLRARLQ
jgi:hypothetical protein